MVVPPQYLICPLLPSFPPSKHIVLVNFSTFHPKLEKLPHHAFYIIQHCLGVNVVATHHEPCKWLIKNGPSMILAERESGVLFLWQKEKVVCCSRVKKGKTSILWHKTMRIQDILTNLGIYLVTIPQEKVLCCSIISKRKTRAPAVRTGILWYKTKRIQDILTNLEFYLI